MLLKDPEIIEIYNLVNKISIISKDKLIKNILTKRKLIHTGGKYKWTTGTEILFKYKDISFSSLYLEYFNDTNDFRDLSDKIVKNWKLERIKGIEKIEIISFLKSKLRAVKINSLIK